MPPNGRSLDELLADLLLADPADRIGYREPILAFGPDAIQPLKRLVIAHPALEGSVSSWLGHLARTRPETATDVRAALRVIAKDPTATMAPQVLASFGGTRRSTATSTRSSGAHRGK